VQETPASEPQLDLPLAAERAPVYQVRVLSKPSPHSGYDLYAAPLVLQPEPPERDAEETPLGAKVIVSGHRF
jgi:hypothetical protein